MSSQKIVTDLPLELLNQIFTYLPYHDVVKVSFTCRRFREGISFRRTAIQKPWFNLEINSYSLEAGYLRTLDERYPKQFSIPFGQTTNHKSRSGALVDKFFLGPKPTKDNITPLLIDFIQNVRIHVLKLQLDNSPDLYNRIPEIFRNNPARTLVWTSYRTSGDSDSICRILRCAKETDCFTNFFINENIFNALREREKARFVSVTVDRWFDNSHLQPATKIKVFHFRGQHRVTASGIRDFLVNWLRTFNDPNPEIDQLEDHRYHRMMGDVRNGIWIGEMAFDCDVAGLKILMDQLAETDIVTSQDNVPGVEYPHNCHHLLLLGETNFIRLFYDVPHFNRGIRILFYWIRPFRR